MHVQLLLRLLASAAWYVALKSFNGDPVPLHETYLHDWLVVPYYAAKKRDDNDGALPRTVIPATNSGVCKDSLGQYYGLGSETRRTATWVPDPCGGTRSGGPSTRTPSTGVGCIECRCALYNVIVDQYSRRIADGHTGGLHCCYDRTRCKVKEGFVDGESRKLFLRYNVTWMDWSDAVVPVRIYILDVTDTALLV